MLRMLVAGRYPRLVGVIFVDKSSGGRLFGLGDRSTCTELMHSERQSKRGPELPHIYAEINF